MIFKKAKIYLYKNKREFIIYTLLGQFVVIISLLSPYIVGNFIDLLNNTSDFKEILKYSLLFLMLQIISQFFSYIEGKLYLKLQLESSYEFNRDLLSHFQRISLLNSNKYDKANMVQRLNNDSNGIMIFSINFLKDLISNSLFLLISFTIIFILNKIIAVVILIAILFYIFFYKIMREMLFKINRDMINAQSEFFEKSYFSLKNLKSIKINSLYDYTKAVLEKSFVKLYEISFREFKINFLYSQSHNLIQMIIEIFTFIYGGYMVINKRISLGEFTMIATFFDYILGSISYFFNLGESIESTRAMNDRVLEILNIKEESNGDILLKDIENIEVKNLNFSYNGEKIIKNFSYKFLKNKIYLIKGENGRGKSTLINLIIGLYIDRINGEIKYNGIDIKDIDMIKLRKDLISVVEQRPVILERESLLKISKDSLKKFGLKEKGYNFYLEEEYSGGENQKLSILNSLEKDISLLILDEPSSNLDEISKKKLLEDLKNLKDKITIIISHDDIFEKISNEVIFL